MSHPCTNNDNNMNRTVTIYMHAMNTHYLGFMFWRLMEGNTIFSDYMETVTKMSQYSQSNPAPHSRNYTPLTL